ncbi:unnamed protein product [Diamesa serratosioi]
MFIFSAKEWALRAQRDDLINKHSVNLTKYYLCSDHFDNDCFTDTTHQKLNKTRQFVPTPTIFENNFEDNVRTVNRNKINFVPYYKVVGPDNKWTTIKAPPLAISKVHYGFKNQKQEKNAVEVYAVKEETKRAKYDDTDIAVEYIIEQTDEETDTLLDSMLEKVPDEMCRLCAKMNGIENLVSIFDGEGNFTPIANCIHLMPNNLICENDGLPQYACTECLEKLQGCSDLIDSFINKQAEFY